MIQGGFFMTNWHLSGREHDQESALLAHRNTHRRTAMSILKGLSFTAAPRAATQSAPEELRRNKLIAHLQEQRAIAEAEAAGEQHVVMRRRWQLTPTGEKLRVEVEKRLRRWWTAQADGQLLLTVRWGSRVIEWERGKAAIVVGERGKLVGVLDKLIAATQAGELDTHIATANKDRIAPKRRAA